MRIRLLIAGVLLAGLAMLAAAENAAALLIDDFSTGQAVSVFVTPGSASSQASGSGILGGERDMLVTLDSGFGITMTAGGDDLFYGQFSDALGADALGTGLIVWDGADDDPAVDYTGLGGVDFTDGGAGNTIAIPLLANNFSADLTLWAYTDGGNYSTAELELPGNVPPQETLSVSFANFTVSAGSGADFANIGAFSLHIDGGSTTELAALFDSVVPEPSTATLLLFGILVISAIRRLQWIS